MEQKLKNTIDGRYISVLAEWQCRQIHIVIHFIWNWAHIKTFDVTIILSCANFSPTTAIIIWKIYFWITANIKIKVSEYRWVRRGNIWDLVPFFRPNRSCGCCANITIFFPCFLGWIHFMNYFLFKLYNSIRILVYSRQGLALSNKSINTTIVDLRVWVNL